MSKPMQCIELSGSEEEKIASVPDENARRPLFTPAVTVGRLCAVIHGVGLFVDFPGNDSGELVSARTTLRLRDEQAGSDVVLAFEDGDPSRPIILGVIHDPNSSAAQSKEPTRQSSSGPSQEEPEKLLITAAREITMRCGKTSITLTNAGKLLLRGAYLLSRSSGVNRIKGGSVQIN